MILPGVILTPALAAWLRAAHDDGQPELDVLRVGYLAGSPVLHYRSGPDPVGDEMIDPCIHVLRANGTELSPTEQTEVRALLAAHAAEPLRMPSK